MEATGAAVLGVDAAAGNKHVQVRMRREGLSPGVEQAKESELGVELTFSDIEQRAGDRLKEQVIHQTLVMEHERVKLVREREDRMEVRDRQEFVGAFFNPLLGLAALALRTVPVAA